MDINNLEYYEINNLIEFIKDCYENDADKYTIKYMEKYGINNVRGGSFCEIKLSDNNRITLNQMIKSVTDKCYICGKEDHFANNCKEKSVKKEKIPTININEKCDCPTSYFSSHRRGKCALTNIISYFDDENEDEDIDKLLIYEKDVDCCSRCGRKNHYETSCYASKHIKGYIIK